MRGRHKRYVRVPLKTEYVEFSGGMVDDKTPTMQVPPGHLRSSHNFIERFNGGYETAPPYERLDGRTAPSSANYASLPVTLTGSVAVGDIVTDDTAAAQGTVIYIADNALILSKISGTFAVGNVKVGSTVIGTCSSAQAVGQAPNKYANAMYRGLAADLYRDDIAAVPGSGTVRGVFYYKGEKYAFRDNAGATETIMYQATASGWSPVSLGYELPFTSGGTQTVLEGDTITGATSGATAVVTRVVKTSGTWSAGDAAGKLIFAEQTGTFVAEDLDIGVHLNVATIAGDSSAISFSIPGGTFDFKEANFTGDTATRRVYGCDGKNRGWEFDGSVFVPLDTGMSPDAPQHVHAHLQQLFFSFGPLAQHSSPGEPYLWSAVVGAGALAMGDDITGFLSQPGIENMGTLAILDRNSIGVLYGTGVDDWNLVPYKEEAGAIDWSAQRIGRSYMFDDHGITEMQTTQAYGNFKDATVSQKVNRWLRLKKNLLTTSCVVRNKNQYWLYFSDGTSLCCTVNDGKMTSFTPCLFPNTVRCIFSGEDDTGAELVLFGDEQGYVYQMYAGTSFDGERIDWEAEFAYDHLRSPLTDKKMRFCRMEVQGDGYAEFQFSYSLEYGSGETALPDRYVDVLDFQSGKWDDGISGWDSGYWDGKSLSPRDFELGGTSVNISLKLKGSSSLFYPLVFSGAFIQFTPTKDIR